MLNPFVCVCVCGVCECVRVVCVCVVCVWVCVSTCVWCVCVCVCVCEWGLRLWRGQSYRFWNRVFCRNLLLCGNDVPPPSSGKKRLHICFLLDLLFSWIRTLRAVAQWLRCYTTNRNVAGSIPDVVDGIFPWLNPFDRFMALGSTQSLTEMSTRSISCG